MDCGDPARAGLRRWEISLDERGLATLQALAMARSPVGRTADSLVSLGGCLRSPDEAVARRDGPGPRGRPGKRW
jgi:hypothetical protein